MPPRGWVILGTERGVCGCFVCVRIRRRRPGGFGFVPSNSSSFLLSFNSDSQNHLTSPQGFYPESPSHSEPCNPLWAAFSLASNFGSPRPASMFAPPSWLKFLNLSGNPRLKFLASPVFCSTCSDALFPGTLRVCSGWPPAC